MTTTVSIKKFEERKIGLLKEQLYSYENWSTETVMQFFYLWLEREFRVENAQVSIIDPCFLSIIIDSLSPPSERNLQIMKHYMDSCRLLLIPVTYRDHWSLLAYLPGEKHWFGCDSRGRYHEERVRFIRDRIDSLGLLGREGESITLFGPTLDSQTGLHESGSFTVFYGFVLIHALVELGNLMKPGLFLERLYQTLPLTNEARRLVFLSESEKFLSHQ